MSPLGVGTRPTWEGTARRQERHRPDHPLRRRRSSRPRSPARCKGFDPELYLEKKEVKKCDPFIHYALAATQMAIEDAGLVIDETNADRVGVMIGSGIGGLPLIERTHADAARARARPRLVRSSSPALIVNMAAGQVSIHSGAKGPNGAPAPPAPPACTRSATPSA